MKIGDVVTTRYKPGKSKTKPQLRKIVVVSSYMIKAEFRDGIHLEIELNSDRTIKMVRFKNNRPGHGGATESLFYFNFIRGSYQFSNKDEDHNIFGRLSAVGKRLAQVKRDPDFAQIARELATVVETYYRSKNRMLHKNHKQT